MRTCCNPDPGAVAPRVVQTKAQADDADGSSHILIDDWDALFFAISARLSASVGEWPAQTPEPQPHDRAAQVRLTVLECVEAMNLLHTTLSSERRQSAST